MNDLSACIASVVNRSFYGINPPPLPVYILSLLYIRGAGPSMNSLSLALLVTAKLAMLAQMRAGRMKSIANVLVFMACSLLLYSRHVSVHSYFAEIFSFFALKTCVEQRYMMTCLLSSCLILTDSLFLPVFAVLLTIVLARIYHRLIDPRNSVPRTLISSAGLVAKLFSFPAVSLMALGLLDILVRNKHSKESLILSLPFQATLKNFDLTQGLTDAHSQSDEPQPTDLYVMDRSVIALMSKKFNTFFAISDKIYGTKEFVEFCEIEKIHDETFTDEEPRFIRNNDRIRLKHVEDKKYIGLRRAETEQKVAELTLCEKDDDLTSFWYIRTDGDYVKSRHDIVTFINMETHDFLCTRGLKKKETLEASIYAEREARKFYIVDNVNHNYYKKMFTDYRAKMTTITYPQALLRERLKEYLARLNLKLDNECHIKGIVKLLACFVFGLATAAILLLNSIAAARFGVSYTPSEYSLAYVGAFLAIILFYPIIGLKLYVMSTFGLLAFFSTVSDIIDMKRAQIKFVSKSKKE